MGGDLSDGHIVCDGPTVAPFHMARYVLQLHPRGLSLDIDVEQRNSMGEIQYSMCTHAICLPFPMEEL